MSILTMYQSNTKSTLSKVQSLGAVTSTPLKTNKSLQQDRELLYNSQLMQKALIESCKKAKENRMNSPTYKVTDTIVQVNYYPTQANQDTPIQKSGKKKALFSGIDSQIDPVRNVHTSSNKTNVKLMMFNEGHYMKKYQQQSTEIHQEKDYRSSIRVYKQEQKTESEQKRLRKSVPGQPTAKDPILSPDSKVDKKVRKFQNAKQLRISCLQKSEQQGKMESIRTYGHANSSLGFRNSVAQGQKDDTSPMKMRESNTYKSDMKSILSQNETLQKLYSRTDYKGCDNIKKSKRISIKMDVPRPTSAFALFDK
ncbi:unnamed protein product (macronuclear) [Paramecium tetraurelia]|uniref:Uncharacterized protein n=1 Tax=Paramecium tetraurelia TaxID=5888 RepID=A0BT83_PARTE|nr:uncharacterized protein GSPATT00031982001 [Paramecium tetraurelia]CAK61750.1 unnamed protein product [Paramecium tetraurelia]|eukprot:XP_001429148.1 hypothetical protein (macronuclear) [Paramecium tetraurelia strain d4-2]